MLRVRLLVWSVFAAVAVLIAGPSVRGEDRPWKAYVESASTEELTELADELEYTDPSRSNHHLAVDVLSRLLERGLTAEQKPPALFRRAVFHLKLDEKQAALADVDAALAQDAANPEYLLMKGSLFFDLGKAKEGRDLATQALSNDDELRAAHQSYQRLAQSAEVSPQDELLLKNAEPLLAMTPHPYFRSAASLYKAGDFRRSVNRIEQYLKVRPYDEQNAEGAYMILAVASSKCPAGGSPQLSEAEVLRREIFAWNLTRGPEHQVEILKSLCRTLHYTHGESSPGTLLAVSGMLVQDGKLDARSAAAARFVRAKAYARLGRYSEALAEIDLSLKAEPKAADGRIFRIDLLTWLQKYDKAIEEADAILAQNPENVAALLLKAQIHAGCPDAKFRDGKSAVKEASKACELVAKKKAVAQQSVDPYKMLVLANASAGDYASAGEAVEQMRYVADSVQEVQLVNRLVQHVHDQKPWTLESRPDKSQLDRTPKLIQELSASQPNLQLAFLQAHYERTCDELLANTALTAAERNLCLRRRALSRYWQGKTGPAIEDVESMLQVAPKDDSLYTLLGRCHLAAGNRAAASKSLERLQQVIDGSAAHRFSCEQLQAEIDLVRIRRADGKKPADEEKLVKQTTEKIGQLIRRSPQQTSLYRMRVAARYNAGEYQKALDDSESCLKLTAFCAKSEMDDIVFTHALILEKLRRFDDSQQFASLARTLEGDSTRSRDLLVRVYRTIGKERLAHVYTLHEAASAPKVQPVADSAGKIALELASRGGPVYNRVSSNPLRLLPPEPG